MISQGTFDRFQILSLDGGGLRGLFSAAFLAAVEEDLNTTITDHFDLIAGTSTGGLIALGLGLGIRPKALVDFYIDYGPHIFSNTLGLRSLQRWLIRRKYPRDRLEKSLRAVFGDQLFGSSTKRLVITSYSLSADDIYLFRTPHAERLRRDYKVPAWQVALATAAAPTYFPACRAVDLQRLVDGGVWANNPAMVALIESYGTLRVPLENTRLLSIGTFDRTGARPRWLDWAGPLPWASSAPSIILRGTSIGVRNQVRYLLGEDRALRVDPTVGREEIQLDNVRRAEDLIARARHHSRHDIPKIAGMFMSHRAQPYVPLHK